MFKMGHVLVVPEQAIVVCKLHMTHIMKPLDVSWRQKKVQSPIWHILDSNRANKPLWFESRSSYGGSKWVKKPSKNLKLVNFYVWNRFH